jgi:SAM-dependent methyltransferase
MAAPFDHIASYDPVLAQSAIGQLQRKLAWNYLAKVVPALNGLEMLELNRGNGEEAALFGPKDFNLLATDISEETCRLTHTTHPGYSLANRVSTHYLDLDNFDEVFDKKFDLIFANFGGLNYIPPHAVQKLLNWAPSVLSPHGRFVALVMPRFCLWECIARLATLRLAKAFQRWTEKDQLTDVQGIPTKTWYYHPAQIRRWAQKNFSVVATAPVGIALPPRYMEPFFASKKKLLMLFNSLEQRLTPVASLAPFADNFIIDLQRKD